ncbi:unnamed protein product [Paramecium sonneborni]|uniref:Uncharacterized protein n=1 Tax=Paramecium sonneborni TaxID=65129 RepID=A0A8S1LBJ1_9CILI|nr:unnamed protein product [Paramecium sonneborni]
MQQQSRTICQLPNRPKRGGNLSEDIRIRTLDTNHFELQFLNDVLLHIYSFQIEPAIPMESEKQILRCFGQFKREIFNEGIKKFCIAGTNLWSYDLKKDQFQVEKQIETEKYRIDIKYVKTINLKEITQKNDLQSICVAKQAINSILKQIYEKRRMKELFGKGKFYDTSRINENELKEFYISFMTGYRSVLCCSKSAPLLQIDYSTKLINTETILQTLSDYDLNDIRDRKQLTEMLKDTSGFTMYSKRFYRIYDVDFKNNPRSLMESGEMTYAQYYYQKYKIQIKNLSQPLLIHLTKKGEFIRLIPELMWKTGLTLKQKNNFKIKQALKDIVTVDPDKRQKLILDERDILENQLKKQNITIKYDTKTQAFEIKKPEIYSKGQIKNFAGGCFEIKDQFYEQSQIKKWVLIYHNKEVQCAQKFVNQFQQNGKKYGLSLGQPIHLPIRSFNSKDWVQELVREFQENGIPQLVVSLIDQKQDKKIYQELKQYLIAKEGVSHQNVTLQLIEKQKFNQIVPKLVQQIHSKLGNQTWNIQKIKEISDKILVIGIDVYHKTVQGNDSCVGFNAQFGQQSDGNFTKVLIVPKGKEINREVAKLLEQSLDEYYRYHNKILPDTIIVFRDGVGYSQINKLYEEEVLTMKEIIKNKYNLKLPQFSFITVNKRINDRFFSQQKENYGIIVADRVVSSNFDYFMIAQQVNQGTPTPTHYTVLENSTTWNEELFWKFTYYQCYNYRNWCGPVRIPAVVQNAHMAAYRIGEVIKAYPSYYLETKLYYL